MHFFTPVNLEMMRKVVCELKSSTCALDPIPTAFKKLFCRQNCNYS